MIWRRRTTRSRSVPEMDPDREVTRRASRAIARDIAVLSAVMVLAGAALFIIGLWVESRRSRRRFPRGDIFEIHVDMSDATGLIVVVAVGVVLLAGLGTLLIARRAMRPLEESMRRQRSFVSDASHELRTPLAVASARAQQLERLAHGDEKVRTVACRLRSDITAMSDIVDDMLASVGGEARGVGQSQWRPALVSAVEDMELVASRRGVHVLVDVPGPPGGTTPMPQGELRRILGALIDNAIDYSPASGTVHVTATEGHQHLMIRVRDEGEGISGITPERVFDRFAHGAPPKSGDESRSSHGIGLALVHDLVTTRGGTVSVESTGSTGTTFLVSLPTRAPAGADGGGGRSEVASPQGPVGAHGAPEEERHGS